MTPDARLARPRRWPDVVAWTLWALAMAVWLVIPWLDDRLRQAGRPDLVQWDLRPGVAAVTAATVGAVLASRRPHHPVGWLLLAQVGTNLATGAAAQYLAWGQLRGGSLPATRAVALAYPASAGGGLLLPSIGGERTIGLGGGCHWLRGSISKGIPCAFAEYLARRDGGRERVERGIPGRRQRIRCGLEEPIRSP